MLSARGVPALLGIIRPVITYFRKSYRGKIVLKEKQQALGGPCYPLILDCKTGSRRMRLLYKMTTSMSSEQKPTAGMVLPMLEKLSALQPHWMNPAERSMSLLNLVLQNDMRKLGDIYDTLVDRFKSTWYPGQQICIDEASEEANQRAASGGASEEANQRAASGGASEEANQRAASGGASEEANQRAASGGASDEANQRAASGGASEEANQRAASGGASDEANQRAASGGASEEAESIVSVSDEDPMESLPSLRRLWEDENSLDVEDAERYSEAFWYQDMTQEDWVATTSSTGSASASAGQAAIQIQQPASPLAAAQLFLHLSDAGMNACGTMRNRKGVPTPPDTTTIIAFKHIITGMIHRLLSVQEYKRIKEDEPQLYKKFQEEARQAPKTTIKDLDKRERQQHAQKQYKSLTETEDELDRAQSDVAQNQQLEKVTALPYLIHGRSERVTALPYLMANCRTLAKNMSGSGKKYLSVVHPRQHRQTTSPPKSMERPNYTYIALIAMA
ncbi:hypothetical protein Bbelb_187360 [Branchiostoma belcheri]|nr:hypothetical protein Bbelb_187360 [Branchiostoma belcheri]